MRRLLLLLAVFCSHAFGYASYSGFCEQGGVKVSVAGQTSPLTFMQSYPNVAQSGAGPSVTVYLTGTTTKAAIYSTITGTAKANPFPCTTAGQFLFFAENQTLDLLFSGTGISAFTRGSIQGVDPASVPTVYNVKALPYGATGDGTTNDTAAVTRAITAACAASGGIIYFPPGTYILRPPSTVKVVPFCSNLTLTGPGIPKIGDNAGSYDTIFGEVYGLWSNWSIRDFTIDQNSVGNPPPSLGDLQAHGRIVIASGASGNTNSHVDNLVVLNIQAINSIITGGTSNTIVNSKFFVSAGNAFDHDYSALYVAGERAVIAGNLFYAPAPNTNGARAAIETHGGGHAVTGNVSQNILNGMNITGVGLTTSTGITVTGNVVKGAYGCIAVYSNTYLGHTTGYGIDGVNVTGNQCSIAQTAYTSVGGAMYGIVVSPVSDLSIKGMKIEGNQVDFELSNDATNPIDSGSIGIGWLNLLGGTAIKCETCSITGNTVTNAPAVAIRMVVSASDLNIDSNTIINPGASPNVTLIAPFRSGKFIGGFSEYGGRVSIKGGTTTDNQSTSRMAYGMYLSCAALVDCDNIDVADESITVSDATATSLVKSVFLDATTAGIIFKNVIISVPAAKVKPLSAAYQSLIYSVPDLIDYVWSGSSWLTNPTPLTPHTAPPTVGSCGTSPSITNNSNDRAGQVTIGTGGPTTCRVTWGTAFSATPLGTVTLLQGTGQILIRVSQNTTFMDISSGGGGSATDLSGAVIGWTFPLAN